MIEVEAAPRVRVRYQVQHTVALQDALLRLDGNAMPGRSPRLGGLNARTWLCEYLQACANNGNQAPSQLDAFLPWAMDAARLAALRACPTAAPEPSSGWNTS